MPTDLDALTKKIVSIVLNDTITFSVDGVNTQKTLSQYVGTHPQDGQPQIYRGNSPIDALLPFIEFRRIGGRSRKGNGGRIVSWKHSFIIKLISLKTDRTATKYAVQERFQQLFQQDQGVQDNVVIGMSIDEYVEYGDVVDGVQRDHIGIQFQCDTYNLDE